MGIHIGTKLKPPQTHIVYVFILGIILVVCWLLSDFVLVKDEIFNKVEEFSFEDKNQIEVKEKIKKEIDRYQSAGQAKDQVCALVNILECRYYLLYNRYIGLRRYYDFIKIVLYPPQRNQLKDKQSYVDYVNRYLKRKRKLRFDCRKFEVSFPVIHHPHDKKKIVEVLVLRTMGKDEEKRIFRYYFKQYNDNRYYLYFKRESRLWRYRIREAAASSSPRGFTNQ